MKGKVVTSISFMSAKYGKCGVGSGCSNTGGSNNSAESISRVVAGTARVDRQLIASDLPASG
jgi:hypothetical protein